MAWDREWRHEVGDSTSWSHELYTLHVCWSAGFGNYNVDRKGICTAYKGISIHSQDQRKEKHENTQLQFSSQHATMVVYRDTVSPDLSYILRVFGRMWLCFLT